MEIDGSKLMTAAGGAVDLAKFIIGDGLREAVSSIVGDVHMEAALLALRTAEISNSPDDRINSAITHLEAAHVGYKRIQNRYDTFRGKRFQQMQILNAIHKDIWVSCLMALCYTFRGDYRPAKQSLEFAKQADKLRERTIDESNGAVDIAFELIDPFAALLNPSEWAATDEDVPMIYELEELCSRINALHSRPKTQQEINAFLRTVRG